jgi:lipid II:glycine glycyltransferase (peptidoglycan interpeptide bridge formation enzyme)
MVLADAAGLEGRRQGPLKTVAKMTSVGELEGQCIAKFGHCDRQSWYELIGAFGDANLYQTWSYDMVRHKRRSVVHMVVRRNDTVVAAAQARVVRVPGMRIGIAYVRWGPMWRRIGVAEDAEVFRRAVRALRDEFSRRRGLVLRLYPLAYRNRDETLERILQEEGYRFYPAIKRDRTLVLDLRPALGELRTGLDQKWRNMLNQAERNGLELISGEEEGLFDEIARMHGEMAARKGLDVSNDIGHLKKVQRDLPQGLKLRVVLCRLAGELCAGAIFAAIGTTAVYVRGATSDAGLRSRGSYLVQWAFVRWLKEQGFLHYDLNGISPEANPGTYHFKRGLAGRCGRDVEFLGRCQVADSAWSAWVVKEGEWFWAGYRRIVKSVRSLGATPRRHG